MKKVLIFLFCLSVSIVGCKKDNSNNLSSSSTQTPKLRETGEWIFQYYNSNHESISASEIDSTLDYLLVAETINDSVIKVTYFESEDDAYLFTTSTGQYPELKDRIDAVRDIRAFAQQHNVDFNSDNDPPQEVLEFIEQYNTGNKTTGVVC